jgi:hypothetical protein
MVIMEEKVMKIYDSNGKLILKVQMSNNRTFKIELDIMEHRCLATSEKRGEWLWHYRLGHLTCRDLSLMEKYRMVSGLPSIKLPSEVCEECVQAKQHRNIFSKDAERKTSELLEVVYFDVCGPKQVNSIGGDRYFVTFLDNHSRKLWTCLINKKREVFEVLKGLSPMQSGCKLKTLRTDGSGEYKPMSLLHCLRGKTLYMILFHLIHLSQMVLLREIIELL